MFARKFDWHWEKKERVDNILPYWLENKEKFFWHFLWSTTTGSYILKDYSTSPYFAQVKHQKHNFLKIRLPGTFFFDIYAYGSYTDAMNIAEGLRKGE